MKLEYVLSLAVTTPSSTPPCVTREARSVPSEAMDSRSMYHSSSMSVSEPLPASTVGEQPLLRSIPTCSPLLAWLYSGP